MWTLISPRRILHHCLTFNKITRDTCSLKIYKAERGAHQQGHLKGAQSRPSWPNVHLLTSIPLKNTKVHVWGDKRWRNNEEKNQTFTRTYCSAGARLDCADQAASQQLTTCLSLVGVKFLAEGGWNKVSFWHRFVDWHLFPALIWENSDWLMCRYALQALKPKMLLLYRPASAA